MIASAATTAAHAISHLSHDNEYVAGDAEHEGDHRTE
jgi:hypothetical protein